MRGLAEASVLIDRVGERLRPICHGLGPPTLDDLGLIPASRQLADDFQDDSALVTDAVIRPDEDRFEVPPDTAQCVFRVIQ